MNIENCDVKNVSSQQIMNKGFSCLKELFNKKIGWELIVNEINHIIFLKKEEDFQFEMKIDADTIHVSMPMKNSVYNYETRFNSYFMASEYIEMHLLNF